MSDTAPRLFTPANVSLREAMTKAIEDELKAADPNTLSAKVEFRRGDDFHAAVVYRFGRDNWALDAGAFAEATPGQSIDYGAFAQVKVTF